MRQQRIVQAAVMLVGVLGPVVAFASGGGHHEGPGLGSILPIWSVVPFIGLLLSIALMPMVAEHWWHHNRNQLITAVAWASPIGLYLAYVAATDAHHMGGDALMSLKHAGAEYVSFIALLGSLYVISGGILLRGDLQGKPLVNTVFLAIGAVIANVIGTTGASMLLIRPVLRTNSQRKHVWHIPLFFIFLVSNIGGALTPIGDPPLFLGYLRGVEFWWTFTNLWAIWLPVVLTLLAMFFVIDTMMYKKESAEATEMDSDKMQPLSLHGNINFLLLAGVIVCVLALSPDADHPDFRVYYAREIGMALLTGASVLFTSKAIREGNNFSWEPIAEVAALFVGIFVAMIPATKLLEQYGGELGVTEPWQYFWTTGALSAFLDNAPTYVTFASMACGTFGCEGGSLGALATNPESAPVLAAISLGSVFLGAGSYIGNGPNFMVRAIAEQSGYKMPSFFGYSAYAFGFLVPVFIVMTFLALV